MWIVVKTLLLGFSYIKRLVSQCVQISKPTSKFQKPTIILMYWMLFFDQIQTSAQNSDLLQTILVEIVGLPTTVG